VFGDKIGSVRHRAKTWAATGSHCHCGLSSLYRPFTATKRTQAAHIGAGADQKTRRNIKTYPAPSRRTHARHAYRDSARPQRTHAPSQASTEASPTSRASAVSSRTERAAAAEKKKKKKGGSHGTGGERWRVRGRGRFAFTAAGRRQHHRRLIPSKIPTGLGKISSKWR